MSRSLDFVTKSLSNFSSSLGSGLLRFVEDLLKTDNPSATINRLFRSSHVEDLRLIVKGSLVVLVIAALLCMPYAGETTNLGDAAGSFLVMWRSGVAAWFLFAGVCITFVAHWIVYVGSVATIVGGICAWAYSVGGARLGVVDLFACEIGTLCRVATVIDTVRRKVAIIDNAPPPHPGHHAAAPPEPARFTSQESYFPVFETNTRDLQSLEADVVINITAFYTYMKTVRDLMRTIAQLRPEDDKPNPREHGTASTTPWRDASRDLIYMLFLGLESARLAIKDLVEFEPEQTERTIVVLISELEAYAFLFREFHVMRDFRARRLRLRWDDYRSLMKYLIERVDDGIAAGEKNFPSGMIGNETSTEYGQYKIWRAARELMPELDRRYIEAQNLMDAQNIDGTVEHLSFVESAVVVGLYGGGA
jgi:hypothetical protein